MTTKIDEKIAALQQKLEQAKKLKNKQIAAERTKQVKEKRVLDARQKILVGAFVLAKLGVRPEDWAAQNADFQDWLTRESDRAAFGLPALRQPD